MLENNATTSLFYDKRRMKEDGTYPVKLTVYYEGDKRRYKTGINLTEADWQRMNGENLRDPQLKLVKRKLNAKKDTAEDILKLLPEFSFDLFAKKYFNKKQKEETKDNDLKGAFNAKIEQLEEQERIGTAEAYETAKNSILGFKQGLKITDVTTRFLEEYEAYMCNRNASPSTIGIYLRHLRAIINDAIKDGILPKGKYPFTGYSIPSSRNVKKALPMEDIKKLLGYKPVSERQQKGYDFWMFSYLCNGMNMKDICLLDWKDIDGDWLSFHRAKTKRTKKKDLRPIKVAITPWAKEIIQRRSESSEGYLFPILHKAMSAKQLDEKVHSFIKFVNEQMEEIRKDLGITLPLKTYAARHSMATVLKRKGVSIELIGELLGHSSLLMTQQYLDDFTDDVKRENANLLTQL